MNQPRLLVKNTSILAFARLVDTASGAILGFFISRILHADGLGVFSAAMAYYGLLSVAGELGAVNYLTREIAKNPDATNRYLVHVGALACAAAAAATGIFLLVLPLLHFSSELNAALQVVILAILPGTLRVVQEAVFVARQRVEFVAYATLISAAIEVGLSVFLLSRGWGVVSLVAVFVLIQCTVTLVYFFFLNRFIARLHWDFQFSFARRVISEIKAFAASSILGGLFARPEIIVLSLISTDAQLGYYSAALKLVDLWYILPQVFMTNVFPLLSRSYYRADMRSQLIQDKSIKYQLAVALPISAGMFAAAEPIITTLYGPGFEPSIAALRFLSFNVVLYCLFAVLWRVLSARGQQNLVLRVQVITLVTRAAGDVVFIAWLGALGAAIMTPLNLVLYCVLLGRDIRRGGTPLRLWAVTGRLMVAAVIMGVLTIVLCTWLPLWVVVPLAAVVYGVLVLLLRAVQPDDIALFRRIVQPDSAKSGG